MNLCTQAPWPADAPYAEVMVPPKAERGRWDPFPALDEGSDDDEEEAAALEKEEGGEGAMAGLVQPDGEWLEGLAKHVEQQLAAAAAAAGEDKAAPPSSSSSSRVRASPDLEVASRPSLPCVCLTCHSRTNTPTIPPPPPHTHTHTHTNTEEGAAARGGGGRAGYRWGAHLL